jgi:enterochelin esterase-like enzyme
VHSYVAVARRAFRDQPFAFGFYVGDEDPRFAPENARLHRELLAAGVPHAYAVYPGAQAESFWREHEEQWVRTAVEHMSGA